MMVTVTVLVMVWFYPDNANKVSGLLHYLVEVSTEYDGFILSQQITKLLTHLVKGKGKVVKEHKSLPTTLVPSY